MRIVHASARAAAVAALVALAAGGLAACTDAPGPVPSTGPTPSAGTASPQDTPTATPAPDPEPEPTLVPEGSAEDNLPLFLAVTERVWASEARGAGRAYIDALVAAGFDKVAMEVTADQTTVGNPAESIQFSVLWGDECLVGQVGSTTGDPHAVVLPVVDGRCLIGQTRPIDW